METVSVLVGQNNAGKSTFIDALRLLAVASRRVPSAQFQSPPDWLRGIAVGRGYKVGFETVDFDFANTHHNYDRDTPSKLQLVCSNRARLTLWLGPEPGDNFTQISTPSGGVIQTRAEAQNIDLCPILVMPPVGQFRPHETAIAKDRIREYMFGRLASQHFRNQLFEMVPEYRAWKARLEETWPSVKVESLDLGGGKNNRELTLILREGPFASEAAWVGSGLQAWMQILWFICRADKGSLVVLDEPDVYLHADLQRKIAKLVLAGGFRQAAIATHSTEIISDVEPSSITVIRKRERSSWRPSKKSELQKVVDSLGSRHNVQLSKLASARKVTLYEGEDQKFLAEFALKLSSDSYSRFASIPWFDIKGVDNNQTAIGAGKALHISTEGQIPVFLIIDRDFRTTPSIEKIKKMCEDNHLILHCWSRKEIENYFVDARPIHRIISAKKPHVLISDVETLIKESSEDLVESTIAVIVDQWHLLNRKEPASKAGKEGKRIFDDLCAGRPLEHVVSGKRLLGEISKRSKANWNVSFGAMTICRAMHESEFDDEFSVLARKLIG